MCVSYKHQQKTNDYFNAHVPAKRGRFNDISLINASSYNYNE